MTKKCSLCGNDIGAEGVGLFCSKSCYSKNYYKVKSIYIAKRVPVICKNCGKESVGKGNSKYCSRECHIAYIRAKLSKKVVEELECPCCKNKYLRAHKAQIYCSNECRMRSRKIVQSSKSCKKCGKLFPKKQGKLYCSDECKPKLVRKDTVNLICIVCGNNFIGMKHYKYCSKICSNRDKTRKNTDRNYNKTGKSCEYCGFNDVRALHSHHINRSSGKGVMFLCANHHYIFHSIVGNGKKSENNSSEEVINILRNNLPISSNEDRSLKCDPIRELAEVEVK